MSKLNTTEYSDEFAGNKRNYNLPVRFDLTGGYLGITQSPGSGHSERVLLTPAQVRRLIGWLEDR
jgi:hypothetical protein